MRPAPLKFAALCGRIARIGLRPSLATVTSIVPVDTIVVRVSRDPITQTAVTVVTADWKPIWLFSEARAQNQ